MLRFDFLPSDFHPQFLILGERDDLRHLAAELKRLATTRERRLLERETLEPSQRAALWLSCADEPQGLRPIGAGEFQWEMTAEDAESFATKIESVANGEQPAGSVVLTVRRFDLEEIPVWISQGEFTDNYLIDSF